MPRSIPPLVRRLAALVMLSLALSPAHAGVRTVTNLDVVNRDGRSFITWDNLPGDCWTYHVYIKRGAFEPTREFLDDTDINELGAVRDSSAVDRRISALLHRTLTYSIDGAGTPLPVSRGLFVVPTDQDWGYYSYAVMAESLSCGACFLRVPGQNMTAQPIIEHSGLRRPIFQRHLTSPVKGDDYVLFISNIDVQGFPAMTNQGYLGTHVGVIPGKPSGALLVTGHGRGGSFLNALASSGVAGEWVMAIDDYLPTQDVADFYFGYHGDYDFSKPWNVQPSIYTYVSNYSEMRVMYLLDWADSDLPHDRSRVYALGSSMGGTFAFSMAWHHSDRIAASMSFIPRLCFGTSDMPSWLAETSDRLWGTADENLPTTFGTGAYEWLDGPTQADKKRETGSSPIIGFFGRNDDMVGWKDKVDYLRVAEEARSGGTWYWDTRSHGDPADQTTWAPMQSWSQLYRYSLDRSYPSFSHCSRDGDLGNGDPAVGDSVGTLNGYLDWDDAIRETQTEWTATLRTRDLQTRFELLPAPEALLVDVTPRRPQHFLLSNRAPYDYTVTDARTGELLQSGTAQADGSGVFAVPGVRVTRTGVTLRIAQTSALGVDPGVRATALRLAVSRQPVRGLAQVRVSWPAAGTGRVDLYDVSGRLQRTLFAGDAHGSSTLDLPGDAMSPGVYLMRARQGSHETQQRVVILH